MPYKHTILLSEIEEQMLGKLIDEKGYRKQDVFRSRLRELYYREYPPYNVSKKKSWSADYTPREYCEKVKGGRVEGRFCVMPRSAGQIEKILLSRVKVIG